MGGVFWWLRLALLTDTACSPHTAVCIGVSAASCCRVGDAYPSQMCNARVQMFVYRYNVPGSPLAAAAAAAGSSSCQAAANAAAGAVPCAPHSTGGAAPITTYVHQVAGTGEIWD